MEKRESALKYINLGISLTLKIKRYVYGRMHIQIKARHVILNASYEFESAQRVNAFKDGPLKLECVFLMVPVLCTPL